MTPERWAKIEEIFQAALDCPPEERQQCIEAECAGDSLLLAEVNKLVDSYKADDDFLESPVWTDSRLMKSSLKDKIASSLENDISSDGIGDSLVGKRVGSYVLTKELGRGGMGVVYLAERADGEFEQKAAVKLIKRGMDTDFVVRRFRHERQVLAALDHPNIARLLDGGTTVDGLPFFVMEFIEGEPLFTYCRIGELGIGERLRLFLQVCAAVQAAHERRIIHRDIKPGNILVNKHGTPKLLDFGIAKILDPDLIHESISPTATQMRLMTPEYASPEQVRGESVTPASDQYALGVLLYELLTGARPYKFSSRAPQEIARVICEEFPTPPSAVTGSNFPASEKSNGRKPNTGETLSSDLDAIILKSLSKNSFERYASIEEFAADIRRYLDGQPVEAQLQPVSGAKIQQLTIAVLPLKILNTITESDTGGNFLSVGLADALITRLSGVQRFVVRPTSSVLRYAEGHFDSFTAGRDLNVEFILDGNVLRSGNRIRVSIQLLDVARKSTVWAERFDEDLTDFLSLEDRISKRAAESLVPKMTADERENLAKRGTDNPQAFEAYLRGRYHWNTLTEDGFAKAFLAYHEAIAHDPNYALAYAGITDYYIWLGVYGVLPPKEAYQPAKAAAYRAIEIDNKLAEAYAGLGFAQLCGDFDWQESRKNARRALELNPNYALAHFWYSYNLYTDSCFEEGIKHAKRAVELDPLSYHNRHTLAWGYYFSRRFDKALEKIDEAIEMFPNFSLAHFTRSWFLRYAGRNEEALKSSERAMELSDGSLFISLGHAQALAAAGKQIETGEILEKIEKLGERQYVSRYQTAIVYCYLNETEKALDSLEQAFNDGEGWLIWLAVEPAIDMLRAEPRFEKLVEKLSRRKARGKSVPVTAGQSIVTASEAETAIFKPSRWAQVAIWKYALAAFLIIFTGFIVYDLNNHLTFSFSASDDNWRNSFASTMSARRLTTTGKERLAAISPDGKQVAFVSSATERQSLWLRQIDTENVRQLVPEDTVLYAGVVFSPDGKFIYYTTFNQSYTARTLNRVSIEAGGEPQKVLDNVNSGISFSGDGKQITYFSFDSKTRVMSLFIAGLDEDGTIAPPQTVATRLQPDYFSGNPAFSPDGKKIAYPSAKTVEKRTIVNLFAMDLESGTEEQIGTQNFMDIYAVRWRRDSENEIVINAKETNVEPLQLWLVSYPSGEMSRLTNDLSNYFGLSLTKNSSALVTAKRETVSNIGIIDLNSQGDGATGEPKQVTAGTDRQDGLKGIEWTDDGQILYIASAGTVNDIMLMNTDGANSRLINAANRLPSNPLLTTDNRYLFFIDEKEQESALWRYEMATGSLVQITPGFAVTPSLTRDNRFLIYASYNSARRLSLYRISVEGGEQTELTSAISARPVISPDGRFIACYYIGEPADGWQIAILPIEGGAPVRIIKPPNTVNLQIPLERPLAWSADNRFIYYLNDKDGISNVFRINVEGNTPERITRFTSGRIFAFSLSPDGKRMALARGSTTSDIVIFKRSK